MRGIAAVLGLTLTLGLVGCRQQCFLAKEDFFESQHMPAELEKDPYATVSPLIPPIPTPASVDYPARTPRHLTLQEAFAIGLENGSPSSRVGVGQGISDDNMITAAGNAGGSSTSQINGQIDRIRAIALQPALAAAAIEASLARFDATWTTSMNWTNTDNLQQGLTSFQNGQRAQFATSIHKAFAAGGVANVAFLTDYQQLTTPPTGTFSVINPLYTARLNFGFEQPLWQNFGTDINQLLASFPFPEGSASLHQRGSSFFTSHLQGRGIFGTFGQVEGIILARLRFDQQRAEFERQVHALLLQIEVAYWKLYQAYGRLYAFEEMMTLVHRAWRDNVKKFEAGTIGPAEFQPIRGQYEEFRGERFAALGAVLEAERHLRTILGLPVEDCTRLVPITPPVLAPYCPDWCAALTDALTHRPELIIARDNVRAAQLQVVTQYNFLKPDLRFVANITPTGFGTRLDGNGTFFDGTNTERTNNAFRGLSSAHFNDWLIGLTLNVPLGFRAENAALRQSKISLAQSYFLLKDQEEKATRLLAQYYQKISEWYRLIQTRRNERTAYGEAVNARFKAILAGKGTVDLALLEVQRRLVIAQVKEYEAISEYNNSLARFEWAKGTILQHNNVLIAEGALPTCAQVRAVEYERERSKALVLSERPEPMRHPGLLAHGHDLPEVLDLNIGPDHNGVAKIKGKPAPLAGAPKTAPLAGTPKTAPLAGTRSTPGRGPVTESSMPGPPGVPTRPVVVESEVRSLVIPPPPVAESIKTSPVMDPESPESPWRKSATPGLPPAPSRSTSTDSSAPGPLPLPGAEDVRPAAPPPPLPPSGGAESASGIDPVSLRQPAPPPVSPPPPIVPDGGGFSPGPPPLVGPNGVPRTLPPSLR